MAAEPEGVMLTAEDASDLIDGMRDVDAAIAGAEWTVVGEWNSFFARFVHLHSDGGSDIAVKFGKGWTAADTEYVAAEIGRVRTLFSSLPGGHVEVPPVLGWSADPAVIALPFVAGENLFAALGTPGHPVHDDETRLAALMRSAGEALGAYHAAETAPDDPATRRVAREDMAAAVRRSGYRSGLVKRLEREIPVVRGYRLSHNDFTVGEPIDGGSGLVILDPPHVRKFDHLHRDLSAFTLALDRALVGERHAGSSDSKRDRLRQAVLEGYRATGPSQLDSQLDRWLLGFYELSRIGSQLVGRVRSRQPAAALRSVRWWVARRRALGPPPR